MRRFSRACAPSRDFSDEFLERSFQVVHLVRKFFVTPLREFAETIGKRRDKNLRRLLIVQILVYAIYWSVLEYGSILYLYMLKVSAKKIDLPRNCFNSRLSSSLTTSNRSSSRN